MNLGRYGSRDLLKAQIFDVTGTTPLMYFSYANAVTNEWTSSRVFATGSGVRRIAWDGDKEGTLTFETHIFTLDHLALLSGEDIVTGASDIYKSEILTVDTSKVTLSETPVGGVSVFKYVNGVIASKLSGSVAGKDVTVTGATDGDQVEVYYQYNVVTSKKLSFTAKGFPKYVRIIGDTLYQDEVSAIAVPAQIIYYKAKPQPNFSVNYSSTGDPSSLSIVFDLFSQTVGGIDTMSDIILY